MENRPLEHDGQADMEMKETFEEEKKNAIEEMEPISDAETEEKTESVGQLEDSSVPEAESQTETGEEPSAALNRQSEVAERQSVDQSFVEKAGDPAEYITYLKEAFELGEEQLSVYAASRIGLGHIRKNTPCQDFCMCWKIPHGVVLLDADGISACDLSRVGAELACKTAAEAVEKLSKTIPDEGEFVKALCGNEFYTGLREEWLSRVNAHWETVPHQEDESALFHYGTTLLFAVVTENWYVTFNLGDGQILLFNDVECMRIRLGEKEGQAPASLIYGYYMEDVQRGVWDRKRFKGILLTTDGIYDRVSRLPWYAGHHYALQAAERFEKSGEPKAPFIYSGVIDGEERTIDLSRQRSASDDCSVVMALNENYTHHGHDVVEEICRHIPDVRAIQLLRCFGARSNYLIYTADGYRVVFAVPCDLVAVRDPRLGHLREGNVRLWKCEESWTHEGVHYGVYRLSPHADCNFLEGGFQCMQFHSTDQYHKVPDEYDRATGRLLLVVEPLVAEKVVGTWKALEALEEHLLCQNMRLNEMAAMWIMQVQDDRKELLVPMEALSEADMPEKKAPWSLTIRSLFPGLIGWLTCREADMPLFAPGAAKSGNTYYLFGAPQDGEADNRFFRIRYNEKRGMYGLYNCSRYAWEVVNADGKQIQVAPGKTVGLSNDCRIMVTMEDGKELVCTGRLI